jgi:3-hydroxybutyryl-CoA dehydrogenase
MNVEDIRTVLILGAGSMGQEIALVCAMHDFDVIVYDVKPEALDNGAKRVQEYADQLVGEGRMSRQDMDLALSRIDFTLNPDDGARADFVNESVTEDADLKGRVFAQFDAICPPHAIFTTNTSVLLPSMFAEATGRPDRFLAMHFSMYVWDQMLVDIMPHPGTSPEAVEATIAVTRRIGHVPVVLQKEQPGYIGNSIINVMNKTAMTLLWNGVASAEDIDRTIMLLFGTPRGMLGAMDHVGLDTEWHIWESIAAMSGDPSDQAIADRLKRDYVDRGWLGAKSGKGFFTYPDPVYDQPGFLSSETELVSAKS